MTPVRINDPAMQLDALVEAAVTRARKLVGIRETSRNRGPEIDEWVRFCGLDPAGEHPWCLAFLQWVYGTACDDMGMPRVLPMTARVARLWAKAPRWMRTNVARRGALYLHLTDPTDPNSNGHVGIVVDPVFPQARLIGVEGNGNEAGSREGDSVVLKSRPFSYVNLGYLDPRAPRPVG